MPSLSKPVVTLVASLGMILVAVSRARAGVYVIGPTDDVRIISGLPNSDFNDALLGAVDQDANDQQRSLLRFDLSGYSEPLLSATLTLHVVPLYYGQPAGEQTDVYRVTAPWTEAL